MGAEKRMNRRGFLPVAALAGLATVLAACSGGAAATPTTAPAAAGSTSNLSGTTINYWFWKDDPKSTVIEDIAKDFESETGIHVNLNSSIAQPDFFNSLVNAVAAGNAPDATHLNTNMMGQLIQNKVVEPLDDRIGAWSGQKDVTAQLWPYVESADGKTKYAVPQTFLMFYMYYRKDLLKAAGVDVPKTQADFVAATKAIASTGKGNYGFEIRGGANGQDQWAAFLVAGGARFIDGSGKVVFNSPEARASNDLYVQTYASAPPGSINTSSGTQMIQEMEAGTATFVINHLGTSRQLTLGSDQEGVTLIPSLSGDPSNTTYMGTMNMNSVLATSQKKDAAFKWISYLAEQKAQLALAKSSEGYLPVVSSVAQNPSFANNEFFQVSLQAAKNGAVAWPPLPGTTKATQQVFQPLFQGALLGKNSSDAVVSGVADALSSQ
jgi:multiple sugar transport system substrate-binding protein